MKVLIVEDEVKIAGLLKQKLEKEEFEVLMAGDGEEGVNLATKKIPDIILLDLILPKMNGVEVLERLEADEKTKSIPVIILTNLDSGDELISDRSNVYDFLVKTNWTLEDVVKKVK